MSKLFMIVDRDGKRRIYDGAWRPTWWIHLSLGLRGLRAAPLVSIRCDNIAASQLGAMLRMWDER